MQKQRIANIPFGPYCTALAGALVDGKPNYATIGAWGVVSQKPVLHCSLKNTHHTTAGIRETGFFSINIPSAAMAAQADACGIVSGGQKDKSRLFHSFYDDADTAPLIEECPLNYLCRVIRTVEVFDFTMFLGEIVAAFADPGCLTDGRPDAEKTDPLFMLHTAYFGASRRVGTVFEAGRALAETL